MTELETLRHSCAHVLAEAIQGLGLEDTCVVTIEIEPSTADGTGSN